MNKTSVEKIKRAARFLRTPIAQQARGYLASPLETALKVLDAFADGKPHTYEEIAEDTGFAINTVKQVLQALEEGGYGFIKSPTLGYQPGPEGGRPTTSIQHSRKNR